MARKNKPPKQGLNIEGTAADDTLSGTDGRDTFFLRVGSGDDTILDFSTLTPDYIMLDSGTGVYDGMVGGHLGNLSDGFQIVNSRGTLVATVSSADANGDGIGDTVIELHSGDSLALLGVDPTDLTGTMIFGG